MKQYDLGGLMNHLFKLLITFLSIHFVAYGQQIALTDSNIASMSIPEIKQRLNDQDGTADYFIGLKFYKGLGIEKNVNVAFKQFLKAAKKGHNGAMIGLGEILTQESVDSKEFVNDISWLKKMADKDDLAARNLLEVALSLSTMPETLKNDVRNYLRDRKPLLDLAFEKAPLGDFIAQQIIQKSNKKMELLKQAAVNGNAEKAYELGKLYRINSPHHDLALAFYYTDIAAKQGYAPALHLLSEMYRRGEGVTRDNLKAFESMRDAASQGLPQAQCNFGIMFLNGFVRERDFYNGIVWIKKAASQENGAALAILGELARQGKNDFDETIEPDYQAAFELFKRSAAQKNFNGMYNLAQFYLSGLSGEKNINKAQELFDKIIDAQSEDSFSAKALMYETGTGVIKDLSQAKKYYASGAQDQADVLSIEGLERVNEKLLKQAEKKRLERAQAEAASSSVSKGKEKAVEEIEEVPEKKVQSSKTKKAREKRKAWAKAKASTSQAAAESESEEESEKTKDIDIAGEALKNALNDALTYDDKSFISEVDTENNKIVIKNPYDNSVITIDAYHNGPITQNELKLLKKFIYDDRVKAWFSPKDQLLKTHTQEQIDRHRFAERVDEVVQLYGSKAVFMKQDGTLEKNRILIGDIKTQDNRILKGTIEFAYYKNKHKQNIVYHRFLHPSSKIRV